jgi:dehydrogenase/reductase SDR family protein 12
MIPLQQKIDVPRPPRETFAYVADLGTSREWDPAVIDACKPSCGPIARGAQFAVSRRSPLGTLRLRYTITRYEPCRLLELYGKDRLFEVVLTVSLVETPAGTHIDYRADLRFTRMLERVAERLLVAGIKRRGKNSAQGLRAALEDDFPAPGIGAPADTGIPSRRGWAENTWFSPAPVPAWDARRHCASPSWVPN